MTKPLTDEKLREAMEFMAAWIHPDDIDGQRHFNNIQDALAELAELRARCERQSALLARCSVLLEEKAMNMTPPAKETGHE